MDAPHIYVHGSIGTIVRDAIHQMVAAEFPGDDRYDTERIHLRIQTRFPTYIVLFATLEQTLYVLPTITAKEMLANKPCIGYTIMPDDNKSLEYETSLGPMFILQQDYRSLFN